MGLSNQKLRIPDIHQWKTRDSNWLCGVIGLWMSKGCCASPRGLESFCSAKTCIYPKPFRVDKREQSRVRSSSANNPPAIPSKAFTCLPIEHMFEGSACLQRNCLLNLGLERCSILINLRQSIWEGFKHLFIIFLSRNRVH